MLPCKFGTTIGLYETARLGMANPEHVAILKQGVEAKYEDGVAPSNKMSR